MSYQTISNSEDHTNIMNDSRSKSRSQLNIIQHSICNDLNGNSFFPMYAWPLDIQLAFWSKPISDKNTFKLLTFFYGNGCAPTPIFKFIHASYNWDKSKQKKRFYQIKWICNNLTSNAHKWYYWYITHNQTYYLNGQPTTHNQQSI